MPLKTWDQLVEDAGDAGKSFEPLNDGDYDFVITESSHRVSQTGKDGYNITAKVEAGPYKGRIVYNTFYISPDSPAALGIFFRQMAVLGLDAAFFKTNPTNEQITAALTNKHFRGSVTTSEYQGKKRNEIRQVNPPNPQVVAAAGSGGTPDMAKVTPSTPAPSLATPSVTTPAPAVEQPAATPTTPASSDPWGNAAVPSMPTGAPSAPF